ncbi:MAG: Npt1/Npt2 family nucleotide transporter [bacterium]|nr:Npt1/Npt2 family nucleotide transporter [bacterium]
MQQVQQNLKSIISEFLLNFENMVRKTFDVRNGETFRVLLMWLYIFLIISTLMIVKPVVNSLFLSSYGAKRLAHVFILIAIFAAPVAAFYSKLLKKVPLELIIIRTLQIVILSLILFWFFLVIQLSQRWILYVFFVWVAVFAVLTSSQFWILANVVFNAREAKRLFGLIGSGAIAGGIFGGYLTKLLATIVGSENLIFICIIFLSLAIIIIKFLWQENLEESYQHDIKQQNQAIRKTDHPLVLIRNSRHLLYLAILVGISVLVAKLVEYQFSAVASLKIQDEDELTAFFGFWLSNLNIASLLIQLFITSRVVGVYGVGTSLFFLPFGILIGAVAVLVHPALWSAILIKISDGSLKNSINKAGMELLALPIPLEIKNQTKSFVDVFVDSLATGVGGLLLLVFTFGFNFSVRHISFYGDIHFSGVTAIY